MRAVASDRLQVADAADELADRRDGLGIALVVDGIRVSHPNDRGIENVRRFHQPECAQLAFRQCANPSIVKRPDLIADCAEVLEPEARERRAGDHVRTPVLEVLDAAALDIRIVYVDPLVWKQVGAIDDDGDGQKVAMLEASSGFLYSRWNRLAECVDEMTQRDGRNDSTGRHPLAESPRFDLHRADPLPVVDEPRDRRVEPDLAAKCLDPLGEAFP